MSYDREPLEIRLERLIARTRGRMKDHIDWLAERVYHEFEEDSRRIRGVERGFTIAWGSTGPYITGISEVPKGSPDALR